MIDGGALIVDGGLFPEIWSHDVSHAYHYLTFLYDSVNGNQCKEHMNIFPIGMLTHMFMACRIAAVIIGSVGPIVNGVFILYSVRLRRLLNDLRSV